MAKSDDTRVQGSLLTKRGMQMAVQMLEELGDKSTINAKGAVLADRCQLEPEHRFGEPFRNIVAERLEQARKLGPDSEAGFCAVLSHVVAMGALGHSLTDEPLQDIIEVKGACG